MQSTGARLADGGKFQLISGSDGACTCFAEGPDHRRKFLLCNLVPSYVAGEKLAWSKDFDLLANEVTKRLSDDELRYATKFTVM